MNALKDFLSKNIAQIIGLSIVILIPLFFIITRTQTQPTEQESIQPEFTTRWGCLEHEIEDSKLKLSIENTLNTTERGQGLSGREELPENQGMMFNFARHDRQPMWMYKMKFPLDFIVLDDELKMTDLQENIPACEPNTQCQVFYVGPGTHVVEVNAGTIAKAVLKKDTRFRWEPGEKCAVPL
ncbi:MAG: hypothetical protein A2788_00460 [Candidatus Abawacabacteria bacterium RIFCSPHIGHO2_01_FULL_46_8]|uniref:DUF192 domain-containing protein n=1 Tax=Candidatus Abawacabacteria bacterium RIFCSPHIGHO2_01_FULL_46_8 TaxID=1817815 RepID=A0A1F4XMT0_9BACT|nr:MAG: hypothetical protein A2788_00460 [Candidatus Abawacabacteria bacterium RIFCSPHIGHO2_01_FULL_46_8]